MSYGERSHFVTTARTRLGNKVNMNMHGDPNGYDALTPLGEQEGIITPSALHFVSSHGNPPPDINAAQHRLMIHGMVERPLVFTMAELRRLPSVSRICFIECLANRPSPGKDKTLTELHGMISCSEWTGVPLSVLLKEAGVKAEASWILDESAEATRAARSLPLAKAMDDSLVAYGQNGEPVRPHNGYPLRLVTPGFEGKYQVKWLRGIKVVDRPYVTLGARHVHEDAADAGRVLHGAGAEVGHYFSGGWTAPVRSRLLHDCRIGMVWKWRHPQS
jgi:sulfane dehydrogenase subunit SoxC